MVETFIVRMIHLKGVVVASCLRVCLVVNFRIEVAVR